MTGERMKEILAEERLKVPNRKTMGAAGVTAEAYPHAISRYINEVLETKMKENQNERNTSRKTRKQ